LTPADSEKLSILITNDDGIHAPGLWALYRALRSRYQVTVIAPDRERSAVGHGITLHQPIRAFQVAANGGSEGWAVSGTPADCVKLALAELLESRPDLVIAGINPGANVGVNLNYSGTVAAAKEAAMYGLKALSVSIQGFKNLYYDDVAQCVAHWIPLFHSDEIPVGTFLNINFPNLPMDGTAGVRVTRQSIDTYHEYFEKRLDPRNKTYYWQGSESSPEYSHTDADGAALAENHISITPVRCDMTDYDVLERLKHVEFRPGNLSHSKGSQK
jgi:5'-nucleotidase